MTHTKGPMPPLFAARQRRKIIYNPSFKTRLLPLGLALNVPRDTRGSA